MARAVVCEETPVAPTNRVQILYQKAKKPYDWVIGPTTVNQEVARVMVDERLQDGRYATAEIIPVPAKVLRCRRT